MEEFLSLRFTGNGVLPSNTPCKEVARLILATEQLIESIFDENDAYEGEVSVSLDKIEACSLGFKFSSNHMAAALVIWANLAMVLNTGRGGKLPVKARESLENIINFVKHRDCVAEIGDSRHPGVVLASITPDTCLPEVIRLSGKTSLIGEVMRVGGVEPKVRLKLATGRVLSCEVSEEIAKQLGSKLYGTVTCQGEGTWDLSDNSLIRFRIREVNSFIPGSVSDAFAALAAAMPKTLELWSRKGFRDVFSCDAA